MKRTILFFSFAIISLYLMTFYSCKKDDTTDNNNPDPTTVTDIDGNVYHTIKIGTQVWTIENLKVKHYRNGDSIPYVKGDMQWELLTTGSQCVYDNDTKNLTIYGRLYNWYAATDSRGLAPVGWHIPSKAEWVTLQTYLGALTGAGGKMKETDTTHWRTPNTGATNESGFTGLPSGCRVSEGGYQYIIEQGYWWTTNEDITNTNLAWYGHLYYITSNLTITSYGKTMGYAVRCIKN